jgi:hypothetical protein
MTTHNTPTALSQSIMDDSGDNFDGLSVLKTSRHASAFARWDSIMKTAVTPPASPPRSQGACLCEENACECGGDTPPAGCTVFVGPPDQQRAFFVRPAVVVAAPDGTHVQIRRETFTQIGMKNKSGGGGGGGGGN